MKKKELWLLIKDKERPCKKWVLLLQNPKVENYIPGFCFIGNHRTKKEAIECYADLKKRNSILCIQQ
jgi:hypothetical protein